MSIRPKIAPRPRKERRIAYTNPKKTMRLVIRLSPFRRPFKWDSVRYTVKHGEEIKGESIRRKRRFKVDPRWKDMNHFIVARYQQWWKQTPQEIDFGTVNSVEELNEKYGSPHIEFLGARFDPKEQVNVVTAQMPYPERELAHSKAPFQIMYVLDEESGKHRLSYIRQAGGDMYSKQMHELVEQAQKNVAKDLGLEPWYKRIPLIGKLFGS